MSRVRIAAPSLVLALTLATAGPLARAQDAGGADAAAEPAQAAPSEAVPAPAQERAPEAPRAGGAPPSDDAIRMGSPPSLPQGVSREEMWPAPTAEDWKLPCLITWQRTFEDAQRVSEATKKPILVVVNMDGEIASEHYAGIRYRRPETARLYDPYVCVIASVYRHSARDYDEQGNRVPCPRFGTVTCGEHITIEPLLYERFFEGRRIAPRHIMVELDGSETYDVFYSWDTQSVFTAIEKGVADRPPADPLTHDDRPLPERVASPDVADRSAVELAYREGTREVRRALIEATLRYQELDHVDLLRMAIFGFDVELARLARASLAQCDSEAAVDLIAEVLKMPLETAEREMLLAAAERLAATYPRARTLVAVHQGLAVSSKLVDVVAWSADDASAAARDAYDRAARIEERVEAAEAQPEDAGARLALAEAFLARAQEPGTDRRFERVVLEDARRAAREAAGLGASGWRLDAVLAVVSDALGDHDEALERAVAAVEGGMPSPSTDADVVPDRTAVKVLELFARARQRAIARAYRQNATWPSEFLADIHAAYAVLASHPLGTDEHVVSHYDFLRWIGATPRAASVLDEGLARFPDSWILHDRLRARILAETGPDGLEAAYAAMLAKESASPSLEWFAGYASLVAAEHHRRGGDVERALACYERAIAHYARGVERNPESRESADHYVALALAGRARVALERGDLDGATREILASFERRPQAAASPDGLNISPVDTAKMLRARLAEASRTELGSALDAALAALDPRMLELPAYEREVPGREGQAERRRDGAGRDGAGEQRRESGGR